MDCRELAPPFCCKRERSLSLVIATSSSELMPKSTGRDGLKGADRAVEVAGPKMSDNTEIIRF